jgi:ABC-type Na+ efflux pump permease subunit
MRTLIVSANLALMLSAVFAPFLGAIAMVFEEVVGRWSGSSLVVWLLKSEENKNSCA